MRERPVVRLALVCLLVLVVGGQLVHYASHEDDRRRYPTGTELNSDFSQYHGQEVDVWLTVETRTDDGFRATNGWTVSTDTLPDGLDPGEQVQVYGVARPGPSIEAQRVVVTDSENRRYMLVVSALGLLVTAGYTLRYWRPAPRTLYFLPRKSTDEESVGESDD